MKHEMNKRHSRKVTKNKTELYPLFETKTGWHTCCKRFRKTGLGELGIGVALYFKMLKYLMLMFALSTLISIPSFVLYCAGGSNSNTGHPVSVNYVLSALTLGNIG